MAASIYFLFRIIGRKNVKKKFIYGLVSMTVGILLAGFFLIPTYYVLAGSQSNGLTFSADFWNYPERFFSLIFPKFTEGDSPFVLITSSYSSNAANILVFGYLPAILLVLKKRFWLSWLFVAYLILYLTPINSIFCLFTNASYSRWLYALIMTCVLSTLYYLKEYEKISRKAVKWYMLFCICSFMLIGIPTLYWRVKNDLATVEWLHLFIASFVLLVINLMSLFMLSNRRYNGKIYRRISVVCISVCAIAQFQCFTIWASLEGMFSEKSNVVLENVFNSYDHFEKDSFKYRTDFVQSNRDYYITNISSITGSPSVQSFHSIKQGNIVDLCASCDTTYLRMSFEPFFNRTSFDALMSVKQLAIYNPYSNENISKQDIHPFNRHIGIFDIYDNNYYIPMGFAYDKYQLVDSVIPKSWSAAENDVPLSLLNAIAVKKVDEANLSKYLSKVEYNDKLDIDSVVDRRRLITCDKFEGDSKGFSAHIKLDSTQVVFFSMIYLPQITATIDGVSTDIYEANLGLSAIIVPEGEHNIRFDYRPKGLILGLSVSIFALVLLITLFCYEKRYPLLNMKQQSRPNLIGF